MVTVMKRILCIFMCTIVLNGTLYQYNQLSFKSERVTKLSELDSESSAKIVVSDNYCYYEGKKGWLYAYSFETKKTDAVIKYVMCDTNICNNQLYVSAENKVFRQYRTKRCFGN